MKILHVLTTLDLAGAESNVLTQTGLQTKRGHDVRVAYLKGNGGLTEDFLKAGASWVGCIGMGPGTLFKLAPRIRWADIVHSHLLKADMLTAVCATLSGRRKHLVSGKHSDEQQLKSSKVAFVHGILGNLSARTIVLSDHVGRYMQETGRLRPEKIRRVYYGVDPTPFDEARARPREEHLKLRESFGLAPDDVVFTCVARFHKPKAHDVLLRAFRLALDAKPESTPPLRLLLVGNDPYGDGQEKNEALAAELKLGDAVHFAGLRRDVPNVLAASDALVQAALWEGLGLVYLEAMCASLPVLTSRVSAIPEVVLEGETGLLVPPSDDQALCDGMLKLAGDADLRRRMGAAGRERIPAVFDLDRMADETIAVYNEVLGRRAG